ncbi:hypothetical protein D3C86_1982890 [compost metagenome]
MFLLWNMVVRKLEGSGKSWVQLPLAMPTRPLVALASMKVGKAKGFSSSWMPTWARSCWIDWAILRAVSLETQ